MRSHKQPEHTGNVHYGQTPGPDPRHCPTPLTSLKGRFCHWPHFTEKNNSISNVCKGKQLMSSSSPGKIIWDCSTGKRLLLHSVAIPTFHHLKDEKNRNRRNKCQQRSPRCGGIKIGTGSHQLEMPSHQGTKAIHSETPKYLLLDI